MSTVQVPLATRMRPQHIDEFVGQRHLLAPGKPIHQAITGGKLHSMILWGPPGSGKTTLARLLAHRAEVEFYALSAVFSGVKDIRRIVEQAIANTETLLLFIDEIHRFNKAQQDAFLPYIEAGNIILIGATTENPSFELNNALLSRCQVYVLQALSDDELMALLAQTLADKTRGYGCFDVAFPADLQHSFVAAAGGDARRCLQNLEVLFGLVSQQQPMEITKQGIAAALSQATAHFDKQGEHFYDQISVLHKSLRGSDPDAALYWFCRMLQGGCDPLYIARRMIRMASEDIGNADPRALRITLDAMEAYRCLGSPEGELALAQAVIYLACAAKSNATYQAYKQACAYAQKYSSAAVPLRFRNSVTKLMRDLDYGKHYRYAHDAPHAYVAAEHYFPDDLSAAQFYVPVSRGLEIKIGEKLAFLRQLDAAAR
jgi:putative ATPase